MNKYTIYINGQELDTRDDISVSLNYQVADILDPSKKKTNFSKTITLPGTKRNNKVLEHIFDVNINNLTYNPLRAQEAIIRVGDNEIFKGNMRIVNIVEVNGQVEYEINITGSLRTLFSSMGELSLKDLDFNEYNHTRSLENVVKSWDGIIYKNGSLTQGIEPDNSVNLEYDLNSYLFTASGVKKSSTFSTDTYQYDGTAYIKYNNDTATFVENSDTGSLHSGGTITIGKTGTYDFNGSYNYNVVGTLSGNTAGFISGAVSYRIVLQLLVNGNFVDRVIAYESSPSVNSSMGCNFNFNGTYEFNNLYLAEGSTVQFQLKIETWRDSTKTRGAFLKNYGAGSYYVTTTNANSPLTVIMNGYGSSLRPGSGYIYPYINYQTSGNIWSRMYIQDMYPAPYVKEVWDKLFTEIGFNYKSRFIEGDIFTKLILPYTGERIGQDEETLNNLKTRVGISSTQTLINSLSRGASSNTTNIRMLRESGTVDDSVAGDDFTFQDPNGQWEIKTFTNQFPGKYDITYVNKLYGYYVHSGGGTIEHKSGSFGYTWRLDKIAANGSVTTLDSSYDADTNSAVLRVTPSSGEHNSPWADITNNTFHINSSVSNVYLAEGDKIAFYINLSYPNSGNNEVTWKGAFNDNKISISLLSAVSNGGEFSKVMLEPSPDQAFTNISLNMSRIVPDIKAKDFVSNIIKMFNLIIMDDPNEPNTLIIEPYTEFFSNKERILDWNNKLDLAQDFEIQLMSEVDAKRFVWSYSQDDDNWNQHYYDYAKEVFGTKTLEITNDFSEANNENVLVFGASPETNLWTNDRVAPYYCTKETYKPKPVKPRILVYPHQALPCKEYILMDNENQDPAEGVRMTAYPYCGMVDNPYDPTFDLCFAEPKFRYYAQNVSTNNTLFNTYYLDYLKNIIDWNARLVTGYFYLTPRDIADFDFRDIIYLKGSYWRVNRIFDYDPIGSDRLTKVSLYKLIDFNIINPAQIDMPEAGVCPTDIIIKRVSKTVKGKTTFSSIYASQSGQEVTEDCCKSLKGNYQDGVCYLAEQITAPPTTNGGPTTTGGPGGTKTTDTTTRVKTMDRMYSSGSNIVKLDTRNNTSQKPPSETLIMGSNNFVAGDSEVPLILGDNNSAGPGIKNTIIIGDGITATESNTIYFGDVKITQDGVISSNDTTNLIDAGEDTVFPYEKINFIDVVDGGEDSVRNYNGDSKDRPIIDGGGETIIE